MKKSILVFVCMICAWTRIHAQSKLIDNAEVGSGPEQHNYVGGSWVHGSTTPAFHNSTLSYSNVAGAYVTIAFTGNSIEWYTEKKYTHGIAAVSIDGGAETTIDLYSSIEEHFIVYKSPTLTQGSHTFKIRATGTKNPASTGFYTIHDYVVTYQQEATVPSASTNTAVGVESLNNTVTGLYNSALGFRTLTGPYQESGNTAVGAFALNFNTKGQSNTALGFSALGNSSDRDFNTAVGVHALDVSDAGYENTAIGVGAGPVDNTLLVNTTAIGANARTTAFHQVRIGDTRVTSIGGQVSWSTLSDGRFKRDVKDDVSGLEFINKLRPVSYIVDDGAVQRFLGIPDSVNRYQSAKRVPIRQTGFIAQEVAALTKKSGYVFNGVDLPDNEMDPYSIRYAEFVVPLVKAVQELTLKIEEQQKQIDQLLKNEGSSSSNPETKSASGAMLLQNNPNPFSTNTEIEMILPDGAGNVKIIIYNLEGKQLKAVDVKDRGKANITVSASELGAGMYLYTLIVDGRVIDTKRMILTR